MKVYDSFDFERLLKIFSRANFYETQSIDREKRGVY